MNESEKKLSLQHTKRYVGVGERLITGLPAKVAPFLRRRRPTPPRLQNTTEYVSYDLPPEVKETFSENEWDALAAMDNVTRKFGTLFSYQDNRDIATQNPQIPFYPLDATRQEIEEAVKSNPQLRSPYSIIVRLGNGRLDAVPMHEYYSEPIRELNFGKDLRDAAHAIRQGPHRDPHAAEWYESIDRSLTKGEHKEMHRIWMNLPREPKVGGFFGFGDRYMDALRNNQFSASAWLDTPDEKLSAEGQEVVNTFRDWINPQLVSEGRPVPPKVLARDAWVRSFGGQAAVFLWTGNAMPPHWKNELGSRFTAFRQPFEAKFPERLDAYRNYTEGRRRHGISADIVKRVTRKRLQMHEARHPDHPDDAGERLGENANMLKELDSNVTAVVAYHVLAEGLVWARKPADLREPEVAAQTLLTEGYLENQTFKNEKRRKVYAEAGIATANWLQQRDQMTLNNGQMILNDSPDFMDSLKQLRVRVDGIIQNGTRAEAEIFVEQYVTADPNPYEELEGNSKRRRFYFGDIKIGDKTASLTLPTSRRTASNT